MMEYGIYSVSKPPPAGDFPVSMDSAQRKGI